ncbi:MAG: glycosyltransferase family 4 protein, partial [Nanoarchaeota archaeon]
MKIALVCPYDIAYPGGVQNHVIQYAKKLKDLGHYVTVIAPTSRQNFLYEATDINLVSAGPPLAVPFGRGSVGRLTYDFRKLRVLWRELNEEPYDIRHLHEPESPSLLGPPALMLANSSSSVIAVTFHSNSSRSRLAGFYSAAAKALQMHRLLDKVDVRLAVSETARDSISKYLPGDYAVIPNGIDVDRFSHNVLPREEFLDGKVNILVVTRMGNNERRKGLEYIVSAFDTLQSRQSNTRLIIVGPGKPDRKTSKLLGKINTDNIMFAGAVSGKELPGY